MTQVYFISVGQLVKTLLEHGASGEARNKNKETPSRCALNSKVKSSVIFFYNNYVNKFENKNDVAVIVKLLYRATSRRRVAL